MNNKELVEFLIKTNESLHASLDAQSKTIASLTAEVAALKKLLLEKDKGAENLVSRMNGLAKIALPKKVEKRKCIDTTLKDKPLVPTPKERGNNGAKRKEYHNLEEIIEQVEPSHPEFSSAERRVGKEC